MIGLPQIRAGLLLAALGWASAGSLAQTYSVNAITVPTFGTVAAGEHVTTEFNNNGTVTVASGTGAWVKGTVARGTITIRCQGSGNPNSCGVAGNNARVKVGNVSNTGRTKPFSLFTASSGSGTVGAGTTTGSTLEFVLSGFTTTGNKTFLLDTRLPVASDDEGGTTGAATATFYVYVAKDPTTPTTGSNGVATITVRRSLRTTLDSNLNFGSILRPASGTGTVIIDATTGNRTTGGTNPPIPAPLPVSSRTAITVTGEPSTTFALTYAPTGNLTMASGADTLTVTLAKTNAAGTITLPASGTQVLGIGGTITVSSTTPRGQYSGNLTVTLTYN